MNGRADDPRIDPRLDVAAFDRVSPAAALEVLRPVCASGAWLDAMVARRPHGDLAAAALTSDTVVAALSWPQVELAAAAIPELADRPRGDDRAVAQLALRRELSAAVRARLATVLT